MSYWPSNYDYFEVMRMNQDPDSPDYACYSAPNQVSKHTAQYSQADLDAVVAQIRNVTAADLCIAWKRYFDFFGEVPHGTREQMAALLQLVRKE